MAESGSRLKKGQPIDLSVAARGCPSVFVGLDTIHDEVVVEHPIFFEVSCHQSCGLFWPLVSVDIETLCAYEKT